MLPSSGARLRPESGQSTRSALISLTTNTMWHIWHIWAQSSENWEGIVGMLRVCLEDIPNPKSCITYVIFVIPLLDLMSTKVTSKKGVLQVKDCFTPGLMTPFSMFSVITSLCNHSRHNTSLCLQKGNYTALKWQSPYWYPVTGLSDNIVVTRLRTSCRQWVCLKSGFFVSLRLMVVIVSWGHIDRWHTEPLDRQNTTEHCSTVHIVQTVLCTVHW